MRAVADSSVLIALSAIGQLALLPRRFPGGVAVPSAVWREVVALLSMELDQGEAEAIAVGCEDRDAVVLLDEKEARRVARRLGLAVLGTVGVLIWARRAGAVVSLREQLDRLQGEARFRLSHTVYQAALRSVGEFGP